MLSGRVMNWLARALMPLLLLSLAALLNPLSEDAGTAGCIYAHAARHLAKLGPIGTRVEDDVHLLANQVQWSLGTAHDHFWYVACLLVAFAMAYLLLAQESATVRVSVFGGTMLAAFASAFVFVSIC